MNFENSGSDGEAGEQSHNKNQSAQTDGSGGEMRAPAAASKRDVQEAERKAEEANQAVYDAVEQLREERAEIEESVEELRTLLEDHQEVLEDLEEHQEALFRDAKHSYMNKSFTEKEEPDALQRAREKLPGASSGDDGEA